MYNKKIKILITGGQGFIARNLLYYLQKFRDYVIYAPSRHTLDLMDADKVKKHLKAFKYDIVIHTATYDAVTKYIHNEPAKILYNNLQMTFNLLNNKQYFGRIICLGSGAEYGRDTWEHPLAPENYFGQHIPTDQYGFFKYIVSKLAEESSDITVLRLFGVYGPYENWKAKFIGNACCRAICGLPIIVHQDRLMDYLYVEDLCKIIHCLLDKTHKHSAYNVCFGELVSIVEIAEFISTITINNVQFKVEKNGFQMPYGGYNKRLIDEFGPFVLTPWKAGITKTCNWHYIVHDYSAYFLRIQNNEFESIKTV